MFYINDIDLESNILALSKIIDKAPASDQFIRERGIITYPTKYQTEKLSITIGLDISDKSMLIKFASLIVEADEYPFIFIRSEKIKSMMFRFTDKDKEENDTSVIVFMLSKISVSVTQELKDFITVNLILYPYNTYSMMEDYSFVSYEKHEDNSHTIKYGIDNPSDSLVFKDFFKTRIEKAIDKISGFMSSSSFSDILILSPYFSNIEPEKSEEDIIFKKIPYYDPSAEMDNIKDESFPGNVSEDYTSDYSNLYSFEKTNGDINGFKKFKYVYWRGDLFNSDPITKTAIQAIEVTRVNNIAINQISGHPYPIIQYMGKGQGYTNMTFISEPSNGQSTISPYTMFKAMLEKYNYNMRAHTRFSAYNTFKLRSLITDAFDIEGYVPAQVFLEHNSENRVNEYTAIFIESNLGKIGTDSFYSIEGTKNNEISNNDTITTIKEFHKGLVEKKYIYSKIVDLPLRVINLMVDSEGENWLDEYISKDLGNNERLFIRSFYNKIVFLGWSLKENKISPYNESTTVRFIMTDLIRIMNGDYLASAKLKNDFKQRIFSIVDFIIFNKDKTDLKYILPEQTSETLKEIVLESEFFKFKNDAIHDLRLGDSFGISKETPYLGVSDSRLLSSAPFIVWTPLLNERTIINEYLQITDEIDKFFNESYGEDPKIEDVSLMLSEADYDTNRGSPSRPIYSNWLEERLSNSIDEMPIISNIMDGAKNVANYLSKSSSSSSFIDWVGEMDSGASGKTSLNTIYYIGTSHGKDLTSMTVEDVLKFQTYVKQNYPENKRANSAAAGKFQAVNSTIEMAVSQGIINKNDLFNETTQNKLGLWAATAKSGKRLSLANDFIIKRNLFLDKKIPEIDFVLARNKYMDSIASEWCILKRSDGSLGGNCRSSKGAGGTSLELIQNNLLRMPLYSKDMIQGSSLSSLLAVPVEIGGSSAPQTITTSSGSEVSSNLAPKPKTNLSTLEESFIQKYAGKIGENKSANIFQSSTSFVNPPVLSPTEEDIAVEQVLKKLGKRTDYTVFDHDTNIQIQARDGVKMFSNGFNTAFPVIKVYIVFGGSNDSYNKYSVHSPNYIEVSGVVSVDITLNNQFNPVDLAILEIANPGFVYTDHLLFWQTFKKQIDFGKYGTPEELQLLVSSMVLSVGNRIHIKGGYSNDPSKLETLFNGEITEINENQKMTILAEGYGRELVMKRYGLDIPIFLSSKWNSGTKESIAQMLIDSEEIQNLGRKSLAISDYIVNSIFRGAATAVNGDGISGIFGEAGSLSDYEPEGRDTGYTSLFGISLFEQIKRQPMLKNIYAEEISYVDKEFQFNPMNILPNFMDNRNASSLMIMINNTVWEMIEALRHRHPNSYSKVMWYENEASLFFGIKDQCYIANGLSEKIQADAVKGISKELYEKYKYKRYKAVSQTHIVSSGVNLITNGMKLSSNFATEINVAISTKQLSENDEDDRFNNHGYWDNPDVLSVRMDDNLKPNYIRSKELMLQGATSPLAAIRYGTTELLDEVKAMYDGEIIIIGNESIKNGDTVFLYDTDRGIMGFVEVDNCRHVFNNENGFLTSFTPRMIVEAKTPYFSSLNKKIRLAFTRAFSSSLLKLENSIDRSELYIFLNSIIDQLGNTYAGGDNQPIPLYSSIHNIMNFKGDDAVILALQKILGASVLGILGYKLGTSALAAGAGVKTNILNIGNKIGATKYGSYSINILNRIKTNSLRFTSSLISKATELATKINGTRISSFKSYRLFSFLFRGGYGISKTLSKSITSILRLPLRHPVVFLIATIATVLTLPLISTIEKNGLIRDPILISPVLINSTPYMANIIGAKQEGVLFDTFSNFKTTLKNSRKLLVSNFKQAEIAEYGSISVFDKDYVEF